MLKENWPASLCGLSYLWATNEPYPSDLPACTGFLWGHMEVPSYGKQLVLKLEVCKPLSQDVSLLPCLIKFGKVLPSHENFQTGQGWSENLDQEGFDQPLAFM